MIKNIPYQFSKIRRIWHVCDGSESIYIWVETSRRKQQKEKTTLSILDRINFSVPPQGHGLNDSFISTSSSGLSRPVSADVVEVEHEPPVTHVSGEVGEMHAPGRG